MGYILLLLVLLAGIFAFSTSGLSPAGLFDQAKNTVASILPKSEKEVLIDNLNKQQTILERFFTTSAPALKQGALLTTAQKQELQQAAEAFTASERLVTQLEEVVKKDESTSTTLIKSFLPAPAPTCKP